MFIIANGDQVWGKIGDRSGSSKMFTTRTRRAVKYKSRESAERIIRLYTSTDREEQLAILRRIGVWQAENGDGERQYRPEMYSMDKELTALFAGAEVLSIDV
jgi:hypothetical protein